MDTTWFGAQHDQNSCYLQKFRLYETRSNFYMIGRDKKRTYWRVLKIDRLEPSELNLHEDSTSYAEGECCELLRRIHEGNKATGGLKFVTSCYGIVGFIKFLGPYYLLLITKRRKIGTICGHSIYAISKSEMIPIPNSTALSNMTKSKNENSVNQSRRFLRLRLVQVLLDVIPFVSFEMDKKCMKFYVMQCFILLLCLVVYNIVVAVAILFPTYLQRQTSLLLRLYKRYKRLLCTVDLSKDFFFSYSYHVMHSLQKNSCNSETRQTPYETMFVWNEFLTRGFRNNLKNTQWTVALVYGFFKQVNLSVPGREFKLTLIARRSRHFAGTRYLKRGVNEKGRVANDVETEQIVCEDGPEGFPVQISSVVQNRGSIPLFWSQETSRLNLKPDVILSKRDENYQATKLHFENLVKRYGNPIIILNLIKTHEKKPRETILRAEFANAIRFINKGLPEENRLRFLHWDLHRHSRKATNVLTLLGRVAAYALNLTGVFYCQLTPNILPKGPSDDSCIEENGCSNKKTPIESGAKNLREGFSSSDFGENGKCSVVVPLFQSGVLRTNCIDCLDRTNVAQYAYGLVALGRQLHKLGYMESPVIDLDNPLAEDLMRIYEIMGDTLALQYGGSAAHNKIFSQRRGQWKAATQSQEFLRTLQRYYSNAYMDAEKQDAINVFLGHFQPQQEKLALWELDSDQHYDVGRRGSDQVGNPRLFIKRSLSDGSLLSETDALAADTGIGRIMPYCEKEQGSSKGLSDSTPDISTCESDMSYSRYIPSMTSRKLFEEIGDEYPENDSICHDEHGDTCSCTNFLDLDWLSSEEDLYDRSSVGLSSENLASELKMESTTSASESGSSMRGRSLTATELTSNDLMSGFSERFVRWVSQGELLCL